MKTFGRWIGIVAVVITVVAALYLLNAFQAEQMGTTTESLAHAFGLNTFTSLSTVPSLRAQTGPVIDWRTYRDRHLGWEVSYPSNWLVDDQAPQSQTIIFYLPADHQPSNAEVVVRMQVAINRLPRSTSGAQAVIEGSVRQLPADLRKSVSIQDYASGQYVGKQVTGLPSYAVGSSSSIDIFVPIKDWVYVFSAGPYDPKRSHSTQEIVPILDTMVASFRP